VVLEVLHDLSNLLVYLCLGDPFSLLLTRYVSIRLLFNEFRLRVSSLSLRTSNVTGILSSEQRVSHPVHLLRLPTDRPPRLSCHFKCIRIYWSMIKRLKQVGLVHAPHPLLVLALCVR